MSSKDFQSMTEKYKQEMLRLYKSSAQAAPPVTMPPAPEQSATPQAEDFTDTPTPPEPADENYSAEEAAPAEEANEIEAPAEPPQPADEIPAPPTEPVGETAAEIAAAIPAETAASQTVGYLMIKAGTGGVYPVEGAVVTVTSAEEGVRLTRVLTTDREGKTERLTLPAKPAALSEVPGNEQPYTQYNITVRAEGFFPVTNLNVPIFAEITTVQPINLIPLPKNMTDPRPIVRDRSVTNDERK